MNTPNQDSRWQSVRTRDPQADGQFVYAVASTGIYCRPSCPARRPKPEHVSFYPSPEAAQQAGFRPCRRCQPNGVSRQAQLVAQIKACIETSDTELTLHALADAVKLTPSYVQRLFKRATGLSPKQYAQALKRERLQQVLRQGESVTWAQYEAGYGSSRSLYETAEQHLGMTPGRYRRGGAGETIRYGFTDTLLGRMMLAATERGVCALRFGTDDETLNELKQEFPNATLIYAETQLTDRLQRVQQHLIDLPKPLSLPLDIEASAFQQQVWQALKEIPVGETRSYQQIAEQIGKPKAVRAVARACASNPVALAIPCHRVIRASGELSGYRWGVSRKRELLDREERATAGRDAKPQD